MHKIFFDRYVGLHVKCSLFLSDFNKNRKVLTHFSETLNIKFHEVHSKVFELFHVYWQTNRQTDRVTLTWSEVCGAFNPDKPYIILKMGERVFGMWNWFFNIKVYMGLSTHFFSIFIHAVNIRVYIIFT